MTDIQQDEAKPVINVAKSNESPETGPVGLLLLSLDEY